MKSSADTIKGARLVAYHLQDKQKIKTDCFGDKYTLDYIERT